MDTSSHDPKTLWDYLQVVRRRKWLFLLPIVVGPTVAVVISLLQGPLYQAKAEVLLSRQNLADAVTGRPDPTAYLQAERFAQTQADLAKAPEIARKTVAHLALTKPTASELLDSVSVSAKAGADVLVFNVESSSRALAARLATEYASQYKLYRKELGARAIQRVRSEVEKQIKALRASGETSSPLYQELVSRDRQLFTTETLQTSNAFLIHPPTKTAQVRPRPLKLGLIGLVLGVLAGLALAFLRDALDTRVRSAEALGEQLGLPLLGRIPATRRRHEQPDPLVLLHDPNNDRAEPFRMLRTRLELTNLERGARTIMATSAVRGEGASTTVANLAVALARDGRHVVLVDLDLRHPSLHRFFELRGRPGLTQVALGQARLTQAIVPISLFPVAGDRRRRVRGKLEVIGTGPLPPNPGEFVGTEKFSKILEQLAERADLVLIDAPPLLNHGDALALSSKVDALFVVTRLELARQPVVEELKRVLDSCPSPRLGYVVTGADDDDAFYHGYDEGNGYDDSDEDPGAETAADSDELVERVS